MPVPLLKKVQLPSPRLINFFILNSLIWILFSSCSHLQPVKYYNQYLDSSLVRIQDLPLQEATIEPGDFLQITFAGKSPEVTAQLNNYGNTKAENPTGDIKSAIQKSIEVDKEGSIELPLIGKVKVSGYTRSQLKIKLTQEAARFLQEPIVYMGTANSKVTVMGEVKAVNTFELQQTKVTIFEALAKAGDMTDFAIPEKVKVYRDINGKRELGTINLADSSMFNSPYFYLRNNDVVYVPAQDEKLKLAKRNAVLPLITYVVSFMSIVLAMVTIFR